MERGSTKNVPQLKHIGGEVVSLTTPHLPEKMGQTGEGQVQWETPGGD
jgi:hypothetical protein